MIGSISFGPHVPRLLCLRSVASCIVLFCVLLLPNWDRSSFRAVLLGPSFHLRGVSLLLLNTRRPGGYSPHRLSPSGLFSNRQPFLSIRPPPLSPNTASMIPGGEGERQEEWRKKKVRHGCLLPSWRKQKAPCRPPVFFL